MGFAAKCKKGLPLCQWTPSDYAHRPSFVMQAGASPQLCSEMDADGGAALPRAGHPAPWAARGASPTPVLARPFTHAPADKLNANPTVFVSTVRGHNDDDFDDSKPDAIDALEVFGERARAGCLRAAGSLPPAPLPPPAPPAAASPLQSSFGT